MAAVVDGDKCLGCGVCEGDCPVNAIKVVDGKATVSEECIGCGACTGSCPAEAITVE